MRNPALPATLLIVVLLVSARADGPVATTSPIDGTTSASSTGNPPLDGYPPPDETPRSDSDLPPATDLQDFYRRLRAVDCPDMIAEAQSISQTVDQLTAERNALYQDLFAIRAQQNRLLGQALALIDMARQMIRAGANTDAIYAQVQQIYRTIDNLDIDANAKRAQILDLNRQIDQLNARCLALYDACREEEAAPPAVSPTPAPTPDVPTPPQLPDNTDTPHDPFGG